MAGRRLIARQTAKQMLALAAELVLVALIAILVLALAWAWNVRFDLTPTKEHTLSDQAQRTARRLDQDATISVFYNSQDQGKVRELKELLQRFAEQSRHIEYRMYDLDRSPLLASRLGVVNYNSGVIEGFGRRVVLRDLTEADLTTQLIRLIEGRERVALFTVGHGEHDPKSSDPRSGLSQAAKALEAENYRIERANDLRGGIPDEVALLVIANPTSDFLPSEIATVTAYLRRGGGALALIEADSPPRVTALLRRFGLDPGNDLIVDERNRLFYADSFAPQVVLFNDQVMPYTGAPPAVLALAQSMRVIEPEEPDVQVAPLAFTGSDTWSDTERVNVEGKTPVFREGVDERGPIPIASIAHVVARREAPAGDDVGAPGKPGEEPRAATGAPGEQAAAAPPGGGEGSPDPGADDGASGDQARSGKAPGADYGSLIAVGDVEFATNLYFGSLGNRDFFLNLSHLAARAESLIAVRGEGRPGGTFSQIYLTAAQARILFATACVLLPLGVLAIGGLVGWRRRRRSAA